MGIGGIIILMLLIITFASGIDAFGFKKFMLILIAIPFYGWVFWMIGSKLF
jgi:hypothetical protein